MVYHRKYKQIKNIEYCPQRTKQYIGLIIKWCVLGVTIDRFNISIDRKK